MSRSSTFLLVLAALVVVVVYVELRLPGPTPPAPTDNAAQYRDLDARLGDLEIARRMLEAPPPGVAPEERAPGADILKAIRRPGADEPEPTDPAASDGVGGESTTESAARKKAIKRVREILAGVKTGTLDRSAINDLWDELAGTGLEDEAIAAFQAHIEAHPEDADGHYGLGLSLTQKLQGSSISSMDQGRLAMRADRAFTKVLSIDDNHFEARLSKAISYTFYPPIAGKGPEAIKHFEILAQRHGSDTTNPMMQEVWFNLGDQYRKAGNKRKAKDAWRRGLGHFPDSERIKASLEAMD